MDCPAFSFREIYYHSQMKLREGNVFTRGGSAIPSPGPDPPPLGPDPPEGTWDQTGSDILKRTWDQTGSDILEKNMEPDRKWHHTPSGGSRISLRWGHQPWGEGRQHTILLNFPKNCMKLKEFGPQGARP